MALPSADHCCFKKKRAEEEREEQKAFDNLIICLHCAAFILHCKCLIFIIIQQSAINAAQEIEEM